MHNRQVRLKIERVATGGILILIITTLIAAACVSALTQYHNPLIVGLWWDTLNGSEWTDQQLAIDISNISEMRFRTLYLVERSILDGSRDDRLNETWTARVLSQGEYSGLTVMWAVWETDNPASWSNQDLNNATFREWFGTHLSKWKEFIDSHPMIIGIVFDDFGVESQYLNMTEFTQLVRQYIPLPLLIEYDDRYDSLNPQWGSGTITEGYIYNYQQPDAWNGSWIDYIQQNLAGSYPSHTLGICLEAFDEGGGNWNPTKHQTLIDHALSYNFTNFEYWAWRWNTPESPAIAAHPEYWQDIKANNEHITTQLTIPELPPQLLVIVITVTAAFTRVSLKINRSRRSNGDNEERVNGKLPQDERIIGGPGRT